MRSCVCGRIQLERMLYVQETHKLYHGLNLRIKLGAGVFTDQSSNDYILMLDG